MAESPFDPSTRLKRDIGRHVRGAFLLAFVGLTLGVALMPRGDELLLIHVRNRDIDQARRVLADRERSGVSTVSSVVAHGELYLLEGRVDEALLDLEAFVAKEPGNAAAWRRLAGLYENAQRLDDERKALARVYQLQPSQELARRLATFYRWAGDETNEAARLRDLVKDGSATGPEALRSARLEAALGQRDVALATLETMAARDPHAFVYADLELFASLLVDAGQGAMMGARVQRLPLVREDPAVLTQLAATMRRWGWTRAAVQVFVAPREFVVSPALLAGRARAAQGGELAPEVLRDLLQIDAVHALADEPRDATVRLALSVRDSAAVDRLLARRTGGPTTVNVGLAIGDAIAHGERDRAQALVARFGDEGLADSPLLALELAVEREDRAGALAWIARIDAAGLADPLEVAAVAQIEVGLGLEPQAFDRLGRLVQAGTAPEWAVWDLAELSTKLTRVDEVLPLLAPSPSSVVAPERRRAWARLVAGGHRLDLFTAWLRGGHIGAPDAPALRDTYYILADCQELATATAVAERLFALHASPDDVVLLAHALTSAGRPRDALAPLRASGLRTPEARGAYATALSRVLLKGDDPTGEIRLAAAAQLRAERETGISLERRRVLVEGLWAAGERAALVDDVEALATGDLDAWLSSLVESAEAGGRQQDAARIIARAGGGLASLDDRRRTDRVRALLELGAADDILLPELRRLAYETGEGWVSIYDEHLVRTARTSEQIELWMSVGRAPATPPALRRSAASRLIDLGAPSAAAGIFEQLAASAAPGDPDVQQLLYISGSAADDHRLDWLMSRLRTAPVADRAAWMSNLTRAGGARRLVAEFPELPADASAGVAEAWLDAHRAAGDRGALANALSGVAASPEASTESLQHAGRLALAESLPNLAAAAFRRVAEREPGDREANRWVGTLAFYERRTDEARAFLTAYDTLGGDEAEPIFQLGELARDERQPTVARRFYERALARLTDGATEPAARALLANVLVRLDDRRRAIDTFDAILRDAPASDHVRADFASALLQWGNYDRAWDVLEAQPRSAPATADGGARRLDLLRLQWLNFEGHYGQALSLIETLETQFPDDADVRLARASFDAARGRDVQAQEQYAALHRDAPERPDVAALLLAREQQRAPHAAFQREARGVSGAWTADSTLVSIDGRPAPQLLVSMTAERMDLTAPQALFADGHIGPLARTVTRFDTTVSRPLAPGLTVAGAVFGTQQGLGAGAVVERHDLRGAWKATVERGRPFWEFLESVAGDGRKDCLSLQRDWRFSADTAGWAVFDVNGYRLSSGDSAASTAMTLGFIRTVRHQSPTLTLQYGLDKEHVRNATQAIAADGRLFAPIPLVSREVHLAGAVTRFPIARLWDVEASGGYTVDRFGGRGSFLTARATPNPSARIGLDVWGERRLYSLATTQQALRGGARIRVRF